MTKKKAFSLSDFHTKTLQETPSKMPLLMDGEDTGCFLMVTGLEAKSVAQHRLDSQVSYGRLSDESESIEDKYEKLTFINDGQEAVQNLLASNLIAGWSFDQEFTREEAVKLLDENKGLCASVIAHAATGKEYFAKK